MGDVIDFKKPKKRKAKNINIPMSNKIKLEYEIKQFLAIRGYQVHHFHIEESHNKYIVGVAITI